MRKYLTKTRTKRNKKRDSTKRDKRNSSGRNKRNKKMRKRLSIREIFQSTKRRRRRPRTIGMSGRSSKRKRIYSKK